MVIECSGCGARFRMKESMLRGFSGAQVRCRKCGGSIHVRNPKAPPGDLAEATPRFDDVTPGSRAEESSPASRGSEAEWSAPETQSVPERGAVEGTSSALFGNVYSLDLRRGGRPKPVSAGGLDISGHIRTEPALSYPEQVPDPPPPGREEAPGNRSKPEPSSLLKGPVEWENEGILSPPRADPGPSPGRERSPGISLLLKPFSRPMPGRPPFPRLSEVAVVYLTLLAAGGLGYLLLRFLSVIANPGGG